MKPYFTVFVKMHQVSPLFSKNDLRNRSNKRRPLDKVIHSIIVATEILLARNSFWSHKETKVHGTSKDLMARTVTAIKETMGMPNINRLLTERTRTMLEKALSCLTSIDVASLS